MRLIQTYWWDPNSIKPSFKRPVNSPPPSQGHASSISASLLPSAIFSKLPLLQTALWWESSTCRCSRCRSPTCSSRIDSSWRGFLLIFDAWWWEAVDLPNYKTYLDLKSRAGAPEASWHLDHPNVLTPDGNVAILVPKCLWPAWSRTGWHFSSSAWSLPPPHCSDIQ